MGWLGRMLGWLLRRLRPREGWAPLLSLTAALLALAAAVAGAGWLPDGIDPYAPVLLGMLFGLAAARKLRRGLIAFLLAGLLAAGLTLLAAALDVRALRDIETLRSQLAAFWRLSMDSFAAGEGGPAPLHPRLIAAGLFFALWMKGVCAGWGVLRSPTT
jgi:hypothetical protein